MQVQSQRILAEVLLPESRRGLGHATGWVLADALQDVDEIGVRINAVQPAGTDRLFTIPTHSPDQCTRGKNAAELTLTSRWVFIVLKCASENGLSLLTRGCEWLASTFSSVSRPMKLWAVIGTPRSW